LPGLVDTSETMRRNTNVQFSNILASDTVPSEQ